MLQKVSFLALRLWKFTVKTLSLLSKGGGLVVDDGDDVRVGLNGPSMSEFRCS